MNNIPLVPAFEPFLNQSKRYKFAHGGRGSGKSTSIATILLLKGMTGCYRILCTREVQKSIKDSVHTLLSDLIIKHNLIAYQILNTEITNRITGSQFIFAGLREHTINSIQSYEGINYCWIEEAQTVTKKSLNILLPTIRKEKSEIIFSYNRKQEIDPIHELFQRECQKSVNKYFENGKKYNWVEYTGQDAIGIFINYSGNPYFPDVSKKELEKDKARDNNLYLHKWGGEPEAQGDYALIARVDIQAAINREVKPWDYICFGVDPARYGDDESVICIRKGLKIMPFIAFHGMDTMRLCGEIIKLVKEYYSSGYKNKIEIRIDETGIGAGVVDRLRELADNEDRKPLNSKEFNILIIPILFGGEAIDMKYRDYGTEMWGNINDALETISLPQDTELISQLTARKYKIESDGRIKLQSKDEMKRAGGHSPDRGDALALCLAKTQIFNFDGEKVEAGKTE